MWKSQQIHEDKNQNQILSKRGKRGEVGKQIKKIRQLITFVNRSESIAVEEVRGIFI